MILDLKLNYNGVHENCRLKKHRNCNALTAILYFKCSETCHLARRAQMYPIVMCIDVQATTSDLSNALINASFLLLFKDLVMLYGCYYDGIIGLLGELGA